MSTALIYNKYVNYVVGFGGYDDRVIVFGTKQFLQKLCFSDTVFMGNYTIKSKSKLFKHIYTLMCFEDGILVPMVFIIYSNISILLTLLLTIIVIYRYTQSYIEIIKNHTRECYKSLKILLGRMI